MPTIEWTGSTVRHIPEEELHAYLDQALSRSQCVEIERHLARCPGCRLLRDDIAALRDHTTALLARIGPPPIIPPPYEQLRLRGAAANRGRWRRIAAGAWAASIIGAGVLAWQFNRPAPPTASAEAHPPDTTVQSTAAPAASVVPAPEKPPEVRPVARGTARSKAPEQRLVRLPATGEPAAPVRFASTVETDPDTFFEGGAEPLAIGSAPDLPELVAQPVRVDPGLQGLWRTILPDSGFALQPSDIPRVPGLPVVQMRVQPGSGESDVTAVDQLLETGEVIRTIAGPAARVDALVDEDSGTRPSAGGDNANLMMTVTIRQGDRMVAVTGPSQALGTLLSRVNVKRRRY
jgi:hypothetical protein